MTLAEYVCRIRDSLPATHVWDERERWLLAAAELQAVEADAFAADVQARGVMLPTGRPNPAAAQARLARLAVFRLLGGLAVPESVAPASVHAREAARARWAG